MHHSACHVIKEDKKFNQDYISLIKKFNDSIRDRFGPEILQYNFPDINLEDTPLYDMYEDDITDVEEYLAGNN